MTNKGIAHIGIGSAHGDDKANEAVRLAVTSPLLETTIKGASHVIINISGDIGLMEANEAASFVQDLAGENANIIFGARYDDTKQDECTITVIATGLEEAQAPAFGQAKPFTYQPSVKPVGAGAGVAYQANAQGVKPSISFNTKPVESTIQEKSITIPTFLQKNRKQ
jgi:cell division protein FtsZ